MGCNVVFGFDYGLAFPAIGEERAIFCRRVIKTGNVVALR